MPFARSCIRSLLAAVLFVGLLGAAQPASASARTLTEAQRIVKIAEAQVGDAWQFQATGPNTFDCSGLVTYVFHQAGLLSRIGGKRRTVRGFHRWFKRHNRANMHRPRVGDLIVWGRNKHIGIYVGDGMAVSALYNPYGVTEHKLSFITNMRITAYLHVRLQRR